MRWKNQALVERSRTTVVRKSATKEHPRREESSTANLSKFVAWRVSPSTRHRRSAWPNREFAWKERENRPTTRFAIRPAREVAEKSATVRRKVRSYRQRPPAVQQSSYGFQWMDGCNTQHCTSLGGHRFGKDFVAFQFGTTQGNTIVRLITINLPLFPLLSIH